MVASASFKHKLDPTAVLRRASTIPGCKSVPVPNSPFICSFLVGLEQPPPSHSHNNNNNNNNPQQRDPNQLARISIFTDTGTVSIGRILEGNMRQVFRRNVTSLDTIEELLRDPPQLTQIDESLIATTTTTTAQQPKTARAQFELIQVGCAILQGEREKIHGHVAALEQMQREMKAPAMSAAAAAAAVATTTTPAVVASAISSSVASTTAAVAAAIGGAGPKPTTLSTNKEQQLSIEPPGAFASSSSASAAAAASSSATTTSATGLPSPGEQSANSVGLSGMEFQFSLPPDAMKDVDRCLTDIHSMGKLVRKVATNGRGTVFLYGNGGVAYTPQIPKALYHRLSQLRHSSYEHRPAYVSLGSRDRYYCSFHDGSFAFKGPKGLDRELKKAKRQPVSVAFGATYDTFAVVFADGSWKCGGRAVPSEFEERLGKRRDIHTVNLGPEGEWFVKLKTKKMWWGGIHSELEAAIEDLLHSGHQLHFLDFGEEGSYFVSYD